MEELTGARMFLRTYEHDEEPGINDLELHEVVLVRGDPNSQPPRPSRIYTKLFDEDTQNYYLFYADLTKLT